MSEHVNLVKEIIRNFHLEDKREFYLKQMFSSKLQYRIVTEEREGNETCLANLKDWYAAFPDLSLSLVEMHEYGKMLVTIVQTQGTHLNQFEGRGSTEGLASGLMYEFSKLKPTQKKVTCRLVVVFVFRNDKIENLSVYADETSLAHQLGLHPLLLHSIEHKDLRRNRQIVLEHLKGVLSIDLSDREIECLVFGVSGFSSKYIGEICDLSFRTVESYLQSGYRKLGCFGKQHCLEIIIEKELLSIVHDLCSILLKLREAKG
ncbi:ester cyclase [Simkania sp.]|uniref:ester cyclase n=1 Tax=Simkania sp. TaxID=34094 RepID=UPI003B52CA15